MAEEVMNPKEEPIAIVLLVDMTSIYLVNTYVYTHILVMLTLSPIVREVSLFQWSNV